MSGGLDIALIQTRTPATAEAALGHVEPLIREAAAGGAKFVLTPEGTNVLEQRRDRRDAAITTEDADVAVLGLRRLAAELGVWLLIGSAIVRSGHAGDGRFANRSLLIDAAGGIVARYDKLHVFDVNLPNGETYRESATVRPGDGAEIADTPWGRSTVVGPWGEIIAKADHDEPCIVTAKLDMEAVARARAAVPALTHDRDFLPAV
jgi:predicted amidohydrolase